MFRNITHSKNKRSIILWLNNQWYISDIMKRPKYKKNRELFKKKEKKKLIRKELVWTLFITLVMVSSIIGFMYAGDEEPEFTYKDTYEFSKRNSVFVYEHENSEYVFRFFPAELEELAAQAELSKLNTPMFYVTFDPESDFIQAIELLRFELLEDIPKMNKHISSAMTSESDIYDLPIIDCSDATQTEPVIKFEKYNETTITEDSNCLIFRARNELDLAKQKDIIMYILLGIL